MKKLLFLLLFYASVAYAVEPVSVTDGGGNADTLEGQNGDYYLDIGNQTGAINYTGISNWDTAVGIVNEDTGVDSHGAGFDSCKVTVNVSDPSKVDIKEGCYYHIQGPEYSFAAITSIDPQFAVGENSRFIGATLSGYTTQTQKWTTLQKQTIIPLARLNAPLGQEGPGSDIGLIRDDRFFLYQNIYLDRIFHEEAVGALYVTGGKIYNSGLQIGQTAGALFDAQKKRHTLAAFLNQSAIFAHLSSNQVDLVATKKPLTVDALNYNPAGSSLVPMLNDNTFTIHTILKSPKGVNGTQEGGLFFIYGDTEYATAAGAIEAISDGTAVPRFTLFVDQATSGLVCVALIVQQRNAASVDTILDRRPCQVCRP
jgi:hypothetical protein